MTEAGSEAPSPTSERAPELSVIIPARNEAEYIGRALASVAAQSWPVERLEVLVVDNGSTDRTAEVVRCIASDLSKQSKQPERAGLCIRLLQVPEPGTSRARNRGAEAARGDYLVFMDADSWMAPNLAEQVLRLASDGHPAGSIRLIADNQDGADALDRGFFRLMEFGKVLFSIRAQMFYCDRSLFLAMGGFDEAVQVAEDREFLTRLQRMQVPVGHLRESWIATSVRRLHRYPLRLGMALTFARWAMGQAGIGRRWRY